MDTSSRTRRPPVDLWHPGPLHLRTDIEIEIFVSSFESKLTEANFSDILEDLLSQPNLLVLIVSALSDTCPLLRWLVDTFPDTVDLAFMESIAVKLLKCFSLYLQLLPHAFEAETFHILRDHRRYLESSLFILQTIPSMTFSDATYESVADTEEYEETIFLKIKHKTQRNAKKNRFKRVATSPVVDSKPFQTLGAEIPTTRDASQKIAADILKNLRELLEFYFDTLRRPDLAEAIKREYFPKEEITDGQHSCNGTDERSTLCESPVEEKELPAYPMVQPMKAALYFDSAAGFGEWRVLISTRADRNLREARRTDAKAFKIIIKKIKELSNGRFSPDNHKRLNGPNTDIPIYEAKMTRDSRLVYQIDCMSDYDSDVEQQVIRVFGIYTHAQLDKRLWDSIGHQLGRKGKVYKKRCTFRKKFHRGEDHLFSPESWPSPVELDIPEQCKGPVLPYEDLEEIHSLLVLEKFVTFSQALLNSILADQDVQHVFQVTPQEKEIIEHRHSCYVLGRSGTGKTTTMLFKMLGNERAWDMQGADIPKLRQIFVTQSRVLAGKVQEYFIKLMESLATAAQSRSELAEIAKVRQRKTKAEDLLDADDDVDWRADLPDRFSLLRDEHFPLFITFDRLCKLVEVDFMHQYAYTAGRFRSAKDLAPGPPMDTDDTISHGRENGVLITYMVFLESYWPHFSQSLTKGLDPSLVFSEFMGVIKGSEEALTSTGRFLSKDAYEGLSHRSQATFANLRNIIYCIFEAYLRRKRERGDYDAADRTHSLLENIQSNCVPGEKVDYLYVDEAQDNLLIDALVLRALCKNPNGLFWAGDTAQTISVGSSFRFNDLKAFLFRFEHSREEKTAPKRRSSIEEPRTFQLAINYRSHGGIVNCAHSVIELITKFWPYAIDILTREQGIVDGRKPVFFSGWDQDTVRYEQFLFGAKGSHIEFGAQQCILVRDEAGRDKLRQQVGDIGLIMTLYESKGLEFNDVLLYNFFEDSAVDLSQWRVVLNALELPQRKAIPAPRFDESRHAGVCSELKFLYVAITRARKNMWIVDCSEKSEPIKTFWSARNEIQQCTPGTDIPRLAVSSSPEEWSDSGKSLFANKRYLQAMHCFERANMHREVAVAHAYYLREQARTSPVDPKRSLYARSKAFLSAADAFLECAGAASTEQRAYFQNAADCYVAGGDIPKAAQAFLSAEKFTHASQLYRKCGLFDEAVKVVKDHREGMQQDVADSIIGVSRLFYFREHKLDKAAELFSSKEEELEFLEDHDLDIARAEVLESLGRQAEAAELYLAEGRTLDAIHLFLKDDNDQNSLRRGRQCILEGLWQNLSFGTEVDSVPKTSSFQQLLVMAEQLHPSQLDSAQIDEIVMLRAVSRGDTSLLRQMGEKFYKVDGNAVAALLCFDHVFKTPPRVLVATSDEMAKTLEAFYAYVQLLRDMAFHPSPCGDPFIQKLFGFRATADGDFLLPTGTFFERLLFEHRETAIRTSDDGHVVSSWVLARMFKRSLCDRLRIRILQEDDLCRRALAFSPCLGFGVHGQCYRQECPQVHVDTWNIKTDWFNLRVRIHLQQILIIQILLSAVALQPWERTRQQWYWLSQLYDAVHPPFYVLGCPTNLIASLIPEATKGLQVVRIWLRHLIYNLSPHSAQPPFLTFAIRMAKLAFDFDGQDAGGYIYQAPYFNFKSPQFLRGQQQDNILSELLHSFENRSNVSISGGILFIQHVIHNRLSINISVLCDFIDSICASLVICMRYQSKGNLQGITLPRSWLLAQLEHVELAGTKDTRLYSAFVDPMAVLLERIYTGFEADHLLFENRDLSRLGAAIKAVFIARICRSLCLLGYNITSFGLREKILQSIRSLQKDNRRFHTLYQQFIQARHWTHLARAVQQSTMDSPMDELVQLFQDGAQGHRRPIVGVRFISFRALEDIRRSLQTTSEEPDISSKPQVSTLRPEAEPFVPSVFLRGGDEKARGRPFPIEDEAESNDLGEATHDADEPEDFHYEHGDTHLADTTALVRSAVLARAQRPPSEKEVRAASLIQDTYRRTVWHRRGKSQEGLSAARAVHFISCWTQAREMSWPNRYYRLLFLGPLPHVLLCLDAVYTYASSTKAKTKKRLGVARHEELEELSMLQTEVGHIMKKAIRLRKSLEPSASIHRTRDLEGLRAYVLDVQALAEMLPSGNMQELRADLAVGVKGIVTVGRPAKKAKPDLCIDDGLEL